MQATRTTKTPPTGKFKEIHVLCDCFIKGALDNFSIIPRFYKKKVDIFIPLEIMYICVMTASTIVFATSTHLP